jgi:hypothetical protein
MSPATARRRRAVGWSRSGLPTICGVKLADGRECLKRAGPFGTCDDHADPARRPRVPAVLDAFWFARHYRAWLAERGRDPVIPGDLDRFLSWWERLPTVDGIPVPASMDLHRLKGWWLTWCRLTGHERLIPFDLSLFTEWWRVA